ncbi:sigma-70 family RNA polymerase sigma factor [Isosphaeraceae bacterium EP7]
MATDNPRSVLRQFRTLCEVGVARDLTDGQLLERYLAARNTSGHLAFEALVERHGPLVWRACRSHLSNPEDVRDAVQATFLILLKQARSLWVRDSLGPWLHTVALRTARRAHAEAARRRQLYLRVADHGTLQSQTSPPPLDDLEQTLHAEIDRLPEHQRAAIILCDLQGQSCEQAARALNRPVGTIKSWRSRARDRLRVRLSRAGFAPEGELSIPLATGLAARGLAAAQADVAVRTLTHQAIIGNVSSTVLGLVQGVTRTMLIAIVRKAALTGVALLTCTGGLGVIARVATGEGKGIETHPTLVSAPSREVIKVPPLLQTEPWRLSLSEAIRIGLSKKELRNDVRPPEDHPDGSIKIVAGPKVAPHRFKAEVMASARLIEQQYWALAEQKLKLDGFRRAVEEIGLVLRREQVGLEVGRGNVANVAEARKRLEQARLKEDRAFSDVITSDHQFRNLLGQPAADGRKIVQINDPPIAEPPAPIWEESLAQMLASQPDVVGVTEELRLAKADPAAKSEFKVLSERRQQVIDRATLSLSRHFQELGTNFRWLQDATKLRTAAGVRLDAQRVFYEQGRIPLDRFFDEIDQQADAIAAHVQAKTNYNTSVANLEEAKGTLLDKNKIVITFSPNAIPSQSKSFDQSNPVPIPPPTTPTIASDDHPAATIPHPVETSNPALADRTYSFHFSLGSGPKPIEFRGSLTIPPKN